MAKKSDTENRLSQKEIDKLIKKTNKTEEQVEIKKFLIILGIIVVLVVGVYIFTKEVVTKDKNEETKEEITIDYSKTILGALLNRPYDEYYVIIYNSDDTKVNYYANLVTSYRTKEEHLKIYIADLKDPMNEKFYNKEKSNPNAKSVEELQVGDITLIKVKNKAINKYIENVDDIKSELGL